MTRRYAGNARAAARKRLVITGESSSVVVAASLLSKPHINLIIVCDSAGATSGVLSKTDIVRHISRCHGHVCTIAVTPVMTKNVVACGTAFATVES